MCQEVKNDPLPISNVRKRFFGFGDVSVTLSPGVPRKALMPNSTWWPNARKQFGLEALLGKNGVDEKIDTARTRQEIGVLLICIHRRRQKCL